jgi:hypothetical protein
VTYFDLEAQKKTEFPKEEEIQDLFPNAYWYEHLMLTNRHPFKGIKRECPECRKNLKKWMSSSKVFSHEIYELN